MTNEEAIEVLKEELDHTEQHLKAKNKAPDFYEELGKYCEAVRIAIKALETGEVYMTGADYNLYIEGYKAGKKDFEPKQGEWINKRILNYDGEFYCSNCNFGLESFIQGVFYNFCPNCGARMVKNGNGK